MINCKKRGVALANVCPLCLVCEESKESPSPSLYRIRVFWDLHFSLCGVYQVMLALVKESRMQWKEPFHAKENEKIWKAGPLCIFWRV